MEIRYVLWHARRVRYALLHGKSLKSPCALCSAAAYCCGAVVLCAIAALLGRFLPRLGPLVFTSGPFFLLTSLPTSLFRCGLERAEIVERDGRQRIRERPEIRRYLPEAWAALALAFIHIDRAVEFDLDGVQAAGRVAVVLGDEAAGVGLVARERVAKAGHHLLDGIRKQRRAARAVAVADHDVGAARLVA